MDKFYLEGDRRTSLRNIITREIVANTLIHREYTSTYQAKFVIENERMYVENANRASKNAIITPDNMEPSPKNPIIASFFRNIGYADQLGSGVRNLFKYSKRYSGKDPEFVEGDIFQIFVPLDDKYSEEGITEIVTQPAENPTQSTKNPTQSTEKTTQFSRDPGRTVKLSEKKSAQAIIELIEKDPYLSQKQMAERLYLNQNTLKYHIRKLQEKGMLERIGSSRKGKWIVK